MLQAIIPLRRFNPSFFTHENVKKQKPATHRGSPDFSRAEYQKTYTQFNIIWLPERYILTGDKEGPHTNHIQKKNYPSTKLERWYPMLPRYFLPKIRTG